METRELVLEDQEAMEWEGFLKKLKPSNVTLIKEENQLVWEKKHVSGYYTTMLGYEAMFMEGQVQIKQ